MSQALLSIEGLVKRFGGLTATDHAQLSVAVGELHAVIGPNGAGKTTLIHQVAGSLAPDAGHIYLAGVDITRLSLDQRVHLGLARSYQITNVFPKLTVHDNLALAVAAREGAMRFWHPARSERHRLERAATVADRIGLAQQLGVRAGALSHAQQRQLEVGLALATEPQLLLLDEPMAGMGGDESQRMVELLQSLRSSCTILLVEHDMDAVFQLADTISTLVAGRIIATGTPDYIRSHPQVQRAYLGEDAVPAPT
ncbi:MAG: ABC transporter ATP-binding protein [Rhodoferax sp.]|nr:ABC transporter ATP-binding protein [Rhodoferax sp.]